MNTPSKSRSPNHTSTSRSSDTMADTARDAVDAVKTKVGDAVERGQTAVSHASDTATQQVKTFASELEAMTKRNPLGALAGAVVVGVLIGILARDRSA